MEGLALKTAAQTAVAREQDVPNVATVPWAALCSAQLPWHDVFDVMPVGILLLDKYGVIQSENQRAKALLGSKAVGRRWFEVIQERFTEQAVLGGDIITQAGYTLSISTEPMRDNQGQIVVLHDVTESSRLQHRLHHLERLSAIGEMAASLAHQIRTPLASAMIYAEHLQNLTVSDAFRQKFGDKLLDRLQQIEIQIKDMLMYCNRGDQTHYEKLALHAFTAQLKQGLEGGASIKCVASDDLSLLCNSVALLGALQNCIDNARHANADNIFLTLDLSQEDHLQIMIKDNGNGMTDAQCSKATQPFYTTRSEGTGLGLAVVKAVVDMHQGQLEMSSEIGVGTEIKMTLPIVQESSQCS